jgi:hypothetical protein
MVEYCKVKGCRFTNSHTTSGHKCGKCGEYGHGVLECVKSKETIRKLNEDFGGDILEKSKRCTVPNCPTFWNHTTDAHHCKTCSSRTTDPECCEIGFRIDCPVCKTNNFVHKKYAGIKGIDIECCVCYSIKADVFFESCKHINTCFECCKLLDPKKTYKKFYFDTLNDRIYDEIDCEFSINFNRIKNKTIQYNDKIYLKIPVGMGCCIYAKRDSKNENFKLFFMHTDSWGQYGIKSDERPYLKLFLENYNEIVV